MKIAKIGYGVSVYKSCTAGSMKSEFLVPTIHFCFTGRKIDVPLRHRRKWSKSVLSECESGTAVPQFTDFASACFPFHFQGLTYLGSNGNKSDFDQEQEKIFEKCVII